MRLDWRYRFSLLLTLLSGSMLEAADLCSLPTSNTIVGYQVFKGMDNLLGVDSGGNITTIPADGVIKAHFVNADTVFQVSGLSIEFVPGGWQSPIRLNSTGVKMVQDLVSKVREGPRTKQLATQTILNFIATAEDLGIYDPDKLNIYYAPIENLTGLHLRKYDGGSYNIIVIGWQYYPETLTHELGHAFSLGHTNFLSPSDPQIEYCVEYDYWDNECNFEMKNLMWSAQPDRNQLTNGQIQRVACNTTSALVDNGVLPKPDPAVQCPDWSVENPCPPLHP